MQNLPTPKISLSAISNLFRFRLKEPQVASYLNLSDEDYIYDCLKTLNDSQYRYLNLLLIRKDWKQIAKIFHQVGIEWSVDYADYLAEMGRENYIDNLKDNS